MGVCLARPERGLEEGLGIRQSLRPRLGNRELIVGLIIVLVGTCRAVESDIEVDVRVGFEFEDHWSIAGISSVLGNAHDLSRPVGAPLLHVRVSVSVPSTFIGFGDLVILRRIVAPEQLKLSADTIYNGDIWLEKVFKFRKKWFTRCVINTVKLKLTFPPRCLRIEDFPSSLGGRCTFARLGRQNGPAIEEAMGVCNNQNNK